MLRLFGERHKHSPPDEPHIKKREYASMEKEMWRLYGELIELDLNALPRPPEMMTRKVMEKVLKM